MIEDDNGFVMNWSLDNELRWVVEDFMEDEAEALLMPPWSKTIAGWSLMLLPSGKYREAPESH